MKLPVALLALTLATPAMAFLADNGLPVRSTGGTDFTVQYRGLVADSDFWCAAGEYAIRMLRTPYGQTIYRTSPPPRRAGQGVSFSLDPTKSAGSTGMIGTEEAAGGMSASLAQSMCGFSQGRRDHQH